ncbi:SAM-dependent methyltransferase [Cloacibacterium normanense]|uniref:SAM-dependent methyltransferase n=1 Tax=Cloacibacterium normanense TaxID=237258 RepID=A0A2S7I7P9_9FLAO|nr:class I SAM-dependent methyltransferase [Cloacibacterium normanense]PPZ92601.1 SAM-dependent methyltransferase [Cloacibacterium normanense]
MSWFKEWFNTPYYHILYKDRDFVEAENFIRNLTQDLQLSKDSKIIDLACGKGRHSVFLQQLGYEVLGVDLSEESIEHNKQFETSSTETPKLTFEVHDMRNELYPNVSSEKVNAVFNLFTSFGYFDDDEDDRKVFSSVKNVLQIDGIFVLDFLNEKFVKNTLVDETTVTKDGIDFLIKKRIEEKHIIKDIFFEDKGESFHYFEKVKLHTLEEIKKIAESFGFEAVKIWGNYQLEDFERETSPRCIFQFRVKN